MGKYWVGTGKNRHRTKAGNGPSNIRIMSASANRARRQGPRKRGSKRSRSWKW